MKRLARRQYSEAVQEAIERAGDAGEARRIIEERLGTGLRA